MRFSIIVIQRFAIEKTFQSSMAYYQLLVGLTILTIGLANPIITISSNAPERCCFPEVFSSKSNLSTQSILPDGTTVTSNVIPSSSDLKSFFFARSFQ